jgi:UDP-N-acetylglucosamine acyltransferase
VLGEGVSIGPFCIVEDGVTIGPGTRLAARVTVKSAVTIGRDNQLFEGVVLGGFAQHLAPPPHAGDVVIGDRNVIRENVTVHRAMHGERSTAIGSDCLLMVGSHVAHDCRVGDGVILTNNVMLGGHVVVGDRACMGGGAAVHQFCRVGRLAMVGGMARVTQDVPPFVMLDGGTALVVGLNRVGLRRAGITPGQVRELKRAYQVIYRSGLSLDERLELLSTWFSDGPAAEFAPFLRGGSRGFVRERRSPPSGGIRAIHDALDDADDSASETRRAA